MPSMKRSPGTTNAAHWVSYYVACSTSWIMPPRSPVMDMGLCNWSEIRISYLDDGLSEFRLNGVCVFSPGAATGLDRLCQHGKQVFTLFPAEAGIGH